MTGTENNKATSNCGTCDRKVREDEISIKCDGNCERWHHKDCTGMTTGEFDIIKRKNSKLLWLCEKCKHKIKTPTSEEEEDKKEMKQAITENKKSCDEIKEQLEEMGNTHDKNGANTGSSTTTGRLPKKQQERPQPRKSNMAPIGNEPRKYTKQRRKRNRVKK